MWPGTVNSGGRRSPSAFAATRRSPSELARSGKKKTQLDKGWDFEYWWRRGELNPRPSVLCLWLYMFSVVDCLTRYRPTGRVYKASPVLFSGLAPDMPPHDPVLYDDCDHWFTGIPVAIARCA